MDQDQIRPRSHLFTVRLWVENIGEGQMEWRGRVQHVTSGEAYYFRDWSTLITHLLQMLPQTETQPKEFRATESSEPDGNKLAPA